MAAAKDYEQLDFRARELRQALAGRPLVATSDPLPEAFAATLGRLLPLDGRVGVALLLTFVIEIMSCFGLAALRALREERGREDRPMHETNIGGDLGITKAPNRSAEKVPEEPCRIIPISSLASANVGVLPDRDSTRDKRAELPSNIVSLPRTRRRGRRARGGNRMSSTAKERCSSLIGSHVPEFAKERLQSASGASLRASELRATYEAWCAIHNYKPLPQQKLGAELTGLGFAKWKSCGLIRYKDLQLVV